MKKMIKSAKFKVAALTLMMVMAMAGVAGATPTLDVSGFSIANSFTHANAILTSLMPVALIGFGIGLGFVVLRFIRGLI